MSDVVDHYIELIPEELNYFLTTVKNIDSNVQKDVDELEKRSKKLMKNLKRFGRVRALKEGESIREKFGCAVKDAQRKVHLSENMVELLNRYARVLDAEIFQSKIALETLKAPAHLSAARERIERKLAYSKVHLKIKSVNKTEPTYCACKGAYYGEMIACDNKTCAIEWYHFPCVGIIDAPKGDWYCPKCALSMRRLSNSKE